MTIKSIDALEQAGKALANNFLNNLDRHHIADDNALYSIIDELARPETQADNVILKALLNRIQKQLEAQQ